MLTGYLCCVLLKQEDMLKMEDSIYASVLDTESSSVLKSSANSSDWINN